MHQLEERPNMNGTFSGRIVLAEGDEVDVDLHLAPEKIRLATPFAEIGLWDRDSMQFEKNAAGGFELSVADDVVTFFPSDQAGFAAALSPDLPDAPPSDVFADVADPVPGNGATLLDEAVVNGGDAEGLPFGSVGEAEPEPSGWYEAPGSTGLDEEIPSPDLPPAIDMEDRPSKFGRSSRERLASAMSDFRDRQESREAESPETVSTEAEEPGEQDASDGGPANESSGFLIPGDEGYVFPDDGELEEISPSHITEDVTVADEIIASQRSLRSASKLTFDRTIFKKVAIGVGIVAMLAGIGFAVPVVLDFFSAPDVEATPTPTTVAVTASTVVTETTAVTETTSASQFTESAFDLAAPAFVERWNEVAARVSPNLRFRSSLPAGDFEVGFTPYIAMLGASEAGSAVATLDSFSLEIDPTGPSESDRLGIQALGLAIAVADPTLEPNERGAVLGEMGLNVRDPSLAGLDGRTTRNGIDYRLFYDAEAVMLRLDIAPRG